MSSGVDSTAVFESRAVTLGMSSECIQAFKDKHIDTMSKFAFGCAFQPGGADETPFVKLVETILGRQPGLDELALARRLWYESHAVVVQDMRSRVERTDADGPKKMPPAERAARLAAQQAKLSGIVIAGDLEPSFALLDKVVQMYEQDQLSYVGPDECSSRAQEIVGIKKDPALKLERDQQGNLKAKELHAEDKADVASDYKLRQAFTRRALAFDQANLIDFALSETWSAHLFKLIHKDVPAGYQKVTITQILKADRELFIKMADECRATIVPSVGGPRPLDQAISKLMTHPDVAYVTLPLPWAASKQKQKSAGTGEAPYQSHTSGGKGKGKKGAGKGKGKKGGNATRISAPDGCVARLEDGRNVCFGFNTARGCPVHGVEVGGRCRLGFHICGRAGCHGNHSMVSCTRQ
jgi:hypothetical protein